MPAHPADELAAQLSAVLPCAAQPYARSFAQLISAVAAGPTLPAVRQAYLDADRGGAAGTIAALAGRTFSAGDTTVSFGSGNTFGHLAIGTIVGGDQYHVTVNLVTAPASAGAARIDPLQHAILRQVADHADHGGHGKAMVYVTAIAAALAHDRQVVADEVELLERSGYVQVDRAVNDWEVGLTAAGRKSLRTAQAL